MLRMVAVSLRNSDSYLVRRQYRQFRARMEPGKANKAMAAGLARLDLPSPNEWTRVDGSRGLAIASAAKTP